VQRGKVRYIGSSNWQAWKIAKTLGISEFRNLPRFDTPEDKISGAPERGHDVRRAVEMESWAWTRKLPAV